MDPATKFYMKQKASVCAQGVFTGFILGSTMAVTRRVIHGVGLVGMRNEVLGGGAFFGVLLGCGSMIRN